MLPWIIIGGIALYGFFALKGSGPNATTVPRQNPKVLPASSDPALDASFQQAIQAIVTSIHTHQGCIGLDPQTVLHFQQTLNAYYDAMGYPPPLQADGVYDDMTDSMLHDLTGVSVPNCVLTFEPGGGPTPAPPTYAGGNPSYGSPSPPPTYGGSAPNPSPPIYAGAPGAGIPQGGNPPPPPPPEVPQEAGQSGVYKALQTHPRSSLHYGPAPGTISPTAGRRTYHS